MGWCVWKCRTQLHPWIIGITSTITPINNCMEKLEWYLVQFTPSKVLIKATWLLNALVFSFFLLSFLSLYTSKFGHWFLILSSSFWYVYYFQVMFSCILCMNNKLLEFLPHTILHEVLHISWTMSKIRIQNEVAWTVRFQMVCAVIRKAFILL